MTIPWFGGFDVTKIKDPHASMKTKAAPAVEGSIMHCSVSPFFYFTGKWSFAPLLNYYALSRGIM